MRIAIIGKKYPFCGIVTYCRELVRALRAGGHDVAFYYLHNEEVRTEDEESLPYLLKTHMFVLPKPDASQRLAAHLAGFEPDVVHASFALGPLDWRIPEICAELGLPLVATFHVALDHRPSFPNRVSALVYRLYARTLRRCDRVVVFSEAQQRRLTDLAVPASSVRILPNGVDVRRYRPGPSGFKAAIGARRLLTYMGRIDPEKNVGKLLRAWRDADLGPDVRLAVMGDGVLGAKLRATYGGLPGLHWLGFVADEERRIDVLRGTDVFVLPSSVEGLSIALLEAMACGAVPLATDVGADGEVVAGVGRTLDPQTLRSELAPAIRALLADEGELERLRGLARRRVVSRYAFADNLAALERIYEEVARPRFRLAR